MYSRVSLEDVESTDVEGIDPVLKSVGYHLRPDEMRPSVWEFEEGDATNRHRQGEQEELYVVLEGAFDVEVEEETFGVEAGDYLLVPPESWRQLTATEPSTLLVVGAPNVKDDGITGT